MTSDETKALIRELYEIRKTNDAARVAAHFTDDAIYSITGCPNCSPLPMSLAGREALDPALTSLAENFSWEDVAYKDIIVEGDRAAVFYTLTITHTPTGESFSTDVADHVTFRDGKIASFTEHVDTARVNALLS